MRKPSVDGPALLAEFKESGLSQKRFCEQRGVPLSTFSYWRKKDRERGVRATHDTPADLPKFIEIELDGRPGSNGKVVSRAANDDVDSLVVELPLGVVIRFRGGAR